MTPDQASLLQVFVVGVAMFLLWDDTAVAVSAALLAAIYLFGDSLP